MAIRIDTTHYKAAHQCEPKPSQHAEWGFEFEGWTYWIDTNYRNACAEVKRVVARDHKVQDATIHLMG